MTRLVESKVAFPYRRSLGPVVGRFMAALGQRRLLGVRAGGRVLVPPLEYDPATGEPAGELVEVGPAGTVTTWTWVGEPLPQHPLEAPFGFALIRLDGADTAMLHAVDAGAEGAMRTGMRVVPRWRDEPHGQFDDLACFVPAPTRSGWQSGGSPAAEGSRPAETGPPLPDEPRSARAVDAAGIEPIETTEFFSSLAYREALAPAGIRYAESLLGGRILGQRCPACGLVYVPPRDFCPLDAIRLDSSHDTELPDRGVVTNFTIVTPVPYPGQRETQPFVRVSVLLDRADAMLGLQSVVDVANDQVRVGMRVEAVWLPAGERNVDGLTNRSWGAVDGAIRGWHPTGEPDLPAERYIDRVF